MASIGGVLEAKVQRLLHKLQQGVERVAQPAVRAFGVREPGTRKGFSPTSDFAPAPAKAESHVTVTRHVDLSDPEPIIKPRTDLLTDPHLHAALTESPTVVMDVDRRAGGLTFSLPLTATKPPLTLEQAKNIESMRLPAPWGHGDDSKVSFELVEDGATPQLRISAEGVEPSALLQLPAMLELHMKSKQLGVIELSMPGVKADFTAWEKKDTGEMLGRARNDLDWAKTQLAAYQAKANDPEHFDPEDRARLATAKAALDAVTPQVDARRADVRAQLAKAPPNLRSWAAAVPRTPLEEATKPLNALVNQQVVTRERVANLTEVIADIEGDPNFSPDLKASATKEMKVELAEATAKLAGLDADVAATLGSIDQLVQQLGLEDAVLARGDFMLSRAPQSGAPGTFEALLNEQSFQQGSVEAFTRIVAGNTAQGLQSAQGSVKSMERIIDETTTRIAGLQARLEAFDTKPAVHDVAAHYVR